MCPRVFPEPPKCTAHGMQGCCIVQLQGTVSTLQSGRQQLHKAACDFCPMHCRPLTTLSEVYERWQTLVELPFSGLENASF